MKLTEDEFDEMIAREFERANRPLSPKWQPGRINAYVCDLCETIAVTVDRDPGTTPFMIPCDNPVHRFKPAENLSARILARLSAAAKKERDVRVRMPDGRPVTMRSVMYRVPQGLTEKMATIEFYRPTFAEYSTLPDGPVSEHIARGGLSFRKIGEPEGEINNL